MKRIVFIKEETEEDYRLTVDALESVLFAACMFHLQATQHGILPVPKELEDIDYVKCLVAEMKSKLNP